MKHSPLESSHQALGAKLVDFGGWNMPLSYPDGTIAEHLACRNGAALFDVSHLGTVSFTGPDALAVLQVVLTNDLTRISPGRAQYTHLLDNSTASVIDDIIVWWLDDEQFHVIPNASNSSAVIDVLTQSAAGRAVDVVESTGERAMIAVQGPTARKVLESVAADAAAIGKFRVAPFQFQGVDCLVAGTGYTGEDGAECYVPVAAAQSFWDALIAAGAVPAGLGARDTLRLEAGFPLHGHELGGGITPLQAGLEWVIGWNKPEFLGRAALAAQKEAGGYRVLRGLSTQGRRPPRQGQQVFLGDDSIGEVTSGNFSPTLGHGIAMALVDTIVEPGMSVQIDMRGSAAPADVVPMPFYRA